MENNYKNEIIFADGMKPKNNDRVDFIISSIRFEVEAFKTLLDKHKDTNGFVDVDIKRSKAGNQYAAVNTYWKDKGESTGGENDLGGLLDG